MTRRLEGKVAVITGGSSGIGLATARRFAEEGAHVFITGRRQKELDAAANSIGPKATAVLGDVSKLGDLDRLYAAVRELKGRVDVLFANAGMGEFAPLGSITEEHFDRTFGANVKGLLFTVQKALPLIPDGGSVILNASVAGSKGFPAFSVYSASKAAVRSFARSWTSDLKERRIRVNVISPGPIDTPIIDGLFPTKQEVDGFKSGMTAGVPLGRMGRAEEIAAAALFLATDESSYVSGAELFVDGGFGQV
jgi:NAD(P)-dependent dehydrogenase (short-subunit alcohol dehydrogenase family)